MPPKQQRSRASATSSSSNNTKRESRRLAKRKRSSSDVSDTNGATATATASLASASPAPVATSAAAPAEPKLKQTPKTKTTTTSTPAAPTSVIYIDDDSDEIALEALSFVAVFADAESTDVAAGDAFWIAQLLDDVTHRMLDASDDAVVRITWLDKDSDVARANCYTYAFDDVIDIDAILCHVYALECADGSLEVTAASLKRIERRLARAKAALAASDGVNSANDDDETVDSESDNEKPPTAARQRRQRAMKQERDDNGSDDGNGKKRTKRARTSRSGAGSSGRGRTVASAGGTSKKLSKREAALIIPPHYASVDIALHDDLESVGTHAFAPIPDDALAANREVIRAVRTQDYTLLAHVTESPDAIACMSTWSARRSVDVRTTALQYAIEADDVQAVAQLLKAHAAVNGAKFKDVPSIALPSHSTGAHTSAFSDYNRRAINASRGGKEGNNALLADTDSYSASSSRSNGSGRGRGLNYKSQSNSSSSTCDLGRGVSFKSERKHLWRFPRTSLKMLTLFYPTGDWVDYRTTPSHVANVARVGNVALLAKMVEKLVRDGGWGFNDLHLHVLATSDAPLPPFRAASVVKKASRSKLQPLHFAALNANSTYLAQLWAALADTPDQCKDDDGFDLLHYAAVSATSDNVRFLLEHNRTPLATSKAHKVTPLVSAIIAGCEDNAVVLLDVVAAQSPETLKHVLLARGEHAYQPLHYAAKHGCVRVIERLLHHGASVNALAGDKTTALCVAAQFGQFDVAVALLAQNAKVDLSDKLDKTPLMFAVKNGHTKLAALLINHGANVNAYDTSENSVAHYAASYGWRSCVELLASVGAEFWSRNAWGFVPLTCALLKHRALCADFMLAHDAAGRFLDFRDREGCTMLYLQCQYASTVAPIAFLVKKGLSPNVPNASGLYPLDVLLQRATPGSEYFAAAAIELLLEHGALAQYETPVDTAAVAQPLHHAIRKQLPAITAVLLNSGSVDPSVQESDGADAWVRAASLGGTGEPFLRLLLAHHNATFSAASAIPFASRQHGKSFFHVLADRYVYTKASEMVAVDLVRELMTRCPNTEELLNAKCNALSPLMALVKNEREAFAVDACALETLQRVDTMYTDVVRLFAAQTTDPEALIEYAAVLNPKYTEPPVVVEPEPATAESNDTAPPATAGGDVAMAAATDNDGNDDVIMAAATDDDSAAEPKYFTVKARNILHVACSRKLSSTARRATHRWYSDDVLRILLEAFTFSIDELNFADVASWATPLTLAVAQQCTSSATLLLERGANPDHSPHGCAECSTVDAPVSVTHCGLHASLADTALITAVQHHDGVTAKLLLAHNASVACTNRDDSTPLHLAMKSDNVAMVKCLLQYGADPAAKNRDANTPLLCAIKASSSIQVRQPHEGEVNYSHSATGLLVAASNLHAVGARAATVVEAALTHDAVRASLTISDAHDRTPIYFAASRRDLPLLRVLVSAHPDPRMCANVCDAFGRTPLHAAVNAAPMNANATFDVERFLLLAGADVNAVDMCGFSALHFALFKVDLDWHAKYDVRLGKDAVVEQQRLGTYDATKRAALLASLNAIPSGESDPVETVSNLVAAHGVDLLVTDMLQRTPIHLAAATGAFVCVSTLLSHLASASARQRVLEAKDAHALTPLASAFLHLRQTTITTLIQNNASVSDLLRLGGVSDSDDGDNDDNTPRSFFYHAVKHSLAGIYHLLLNAKFSRRQAVEDAVLCGEFQLASNLIVGLEVANEGRSLGAPNARTGETLLHGLARVEKPFDDLPRTLAWTLLEHGVDVHAVNRAGNSALHFAAQSGNAHLMDFLRHHACNVNARNDAGDTPLTFALRTQRAQVDKCVALVDYFLDVPTFDLHATDRAGRNVLLLVLDLFIASFARPDSTLFRTVAKLLQRGVTPDLVFQSEKHVWRDVFGTDARARTTQRAATNCLDDSAIATDITVDTADATDATEAVATSEMTTALVLVIYMAPVIMRYELLALLFTHNAKLTVCDTRGNAALAHLVAKNLKGELRLALGKSCTANDARAQQREIQAAVAQPNAVGQTPLHVAVQALAYGALENHDVVALLLESGARLDTSVLDCIRTQQSRVLFRFVRATFPHAVPEVTESEFFGDVDNDSDDDDVAMDGVLPAVEDDAAEYLAQAEAAGKFTRTPVTPDVHNRCDVGRVKRVYCALDAATHEPLAGEFFNVLLTKVDVKNGRFGVNAFYRMQVVHDELQDIYVLFTNWGRIGEEGKYQNTPFRTAADAVTEFQKIFRSKTGNVWDARRTAFVKKLGKYNLVQRVDVHTEIADDVTEPFHARVELADGTEPEAFAPLATPQPRSLTQMLYAITDIRHLQLAAQQDCSYSEELPLAKKPELDAAIAKLRAVLVVLSERAGVDSAIEALAGDVSDDGSIKLQALSTQYSELTEVISETSSRYYEVMPCNENALGSSIEAFETVEQVHAELARLQQLVEITQTYKILLGAKLRQQSVHPLDYCRAALRVQLAPLEAASHERALLCTYFFRGVRAVDHAKYKVSNIFRVDRHGEKQRLADVLQSDAALQRASTTHLLWHGTRRTNLMGILGQGLRIAPPEAPHHGYAYGKGLYFADVAHKSLGYCDAPYTIDETHVDAESGENVTTSRYVKYMLLCQVALGESQLADSAREPTKQFTNCADVASVKAPGAHAPDPFKSVVSPDCDAVVPVGRVSEPGVGYPIAVAWGIEKCDAFNGLRKQLDAAGMKFFEAFAARHASEEEGGSAVELDGDDKYHVVDRWNSYNTTVKGLVLKRPRQGDAIEYGFDLSIRFTAEVSDWQNKTAHTFHVRRYRNVLFATLAAHGYNCEREQSYHSRDSYNELIVYKEAQARIRYLVEVEIVGHRPWGWWR